MTATDPKETVIVIRMFVLSSAFLALSTAAGSTVLSPLTDVSVDEAKALGFEIVLTADLSSKCALWVHVTAPQKIGELTVQSVGGGLLEGDEPIFAPSGAASGAKYHALMSGSLLPKLAIIATYVGDGGATVYRLRFADKKWQCN